MGWTSRLLLLSLLGIAACQQRSIGSDSRRRNRVPAGKSEVIDFNCPEDFGYYPHPADCTQYYVCVFGGALQESCTGGLMYSHELQTCDWPRNVICSLSRQGVSTVRITDPRTSASTPIRPATESLTPSVGSFSGSSFPSQDSQATDLFPVRIQQGGSERGARVFTSSSPSQQSLAQQTIDQLSRFPKTKALQESNIRSVVQTNNPSAFQAPQRPKPTPAPLLSQTPRPSARPTARATSRPPPAITFDDSFYPGLNFTDADYYYYYDDLLYDYYDTDFTATATPAPARRPTTTASTRVSSSSSSTSRGRSSSSQNDNRSGPSQQKLLSSPSSSRNSLRPLPKSSSIQVTPASSSLRAIKKPSFQTANSRSSRISLSPTRSSPLSLTRNRTRSLSVPQTSPKISTSQRFRSSSLPKFPSISKSPTLQSQFKPSHTSSTLTSSSLRTGIPAPKTPPTTTSRPVSRPRGTSPPRRTPPQASSGPATTDNSIPSRSRRPTLKPVNVIAPTTSEAIDIFKFPPKRPAARYPQPPVESVAVKCDPKVCRLPDCSCGGAAVPGGIAPQDTPQIVLLTFDDSINDLNKGHYEDLFKVGRKNPNGCPIQATFYVSHEWTDYGQVQTMYSEGHEMASHSITHSFGEQFSEKKWAKEVAGQREILAAYGGVKMEDVTGMRAPFLAIGGNRMFKMLYDQNFTYDSSMPVYENNPPSWPYTLDYKVFHDCMIPPCPTLSYPGVWQVPMVMWQDLNGGRCSMGDACTTPPDAEGVYKMLIKNFERHYTTNRAPFGLFYHAAWFTTPHHKEGFIAFLDTITAMDDVWLVTNQQALEYVRDSVPLSQVKSYKPFQCNYPDRPPRCERPKVCNVWHKGGVRYMRTCMKCPEKYPWTGNTGVRSPLNDL